MTLNIKTAGLWSLRIIPAAILLQTLYFKFTGAEESVYIFTTIGMEPWGRIGSGVFELIASILILLPRTTVFGALLGAGLMCGAIFFHLTKLGIEIKEDGGLLFIYAIIVMACCLLLILFYRKTLSGLVQKNYKK